MGGRAGGGAGRGGVMGRQWQSYTDEQIRKGNSLHIFGASKEVAKNAVYNGEGTPKKIFSFGGSPSKPNVFWGGKDGFQNKVTLNGKAEFGKFVANLVKKGYQTY